jgi:hypothetical protein
MFRFGRSDKRKLLAMPINSRTIEQTELDLETARGQFAALQLDPDIADATKLLGAAIAQAGAEIALALVHASSQSS